MTTSSPVVSTSSPGVDPAVKRRSWLVILCTTLFALAVGAGGWWFVHRGIPNVPTDAGQLTEVMADAPPGMYRGSFNARPMMRNPMRIMANRLVAGVPDGVMAAGTGYVVKAGNTHVDATRNANSGKWQFRFSYVNEPLATPQQLEMVQAMISARNPAIAAKAGVAADQLEKLKKVPAGGMIVDNADRDKIAQLFAAWLNAAGRSASTQASTALIPPAAKPAETALVSALAAIGQKQLGPSKQNAADRAAQIHTILGDATIAKLK